VTPAAAMRFEPILQTQVKTTHPRRGESAAPRNSKSKGKTNDIVKLHQWYHPNSLRVKFKCLK
jgi:hypothetical protein